MDCIKKRKIRATIYVLLAGFCWGTIGIFSRVLSNYNINSVQIALLRTLITFISVFMILMITDRKKIIIDIKDTWIFMGSGILSIAFFNICYFISIGKNSLSLASILLYTAPSLVVIMSYVFFREKMTKQKVLALIIAFIGLLCAVGIFSSSLQTSIMGLLAGLGSGFGYALYSIFSKIALKKYSWITLLFYTFLFATICLLPLSNPIILVSVVIVNMKVLMTTLALGVFATLLPFLLYTKGIETLEVGTASILTFVEPVVATIIGIVLFNEVITISNVGGILLIIISITVLNKKSKISVELNHTQVRQYVSNKIE